MPPSANDLPGRKALAPRAKPGGRRKPGKQPGARLRSEKATRHRYAIRSYASTSGKRGVPVLAAPPRDALAGNAWMPALPEIA